MAASGDSPLTPDDIADALRIARERDVAPARLHAQIRAMHEQQSRRPAWRGSGVFAGAFAAAVAAVVALVVLVAPGGTPGAPTLAQAVALAAKGPSAPAPVADPSEPGRLGASVGEVYFPDWAKPFHWRAVGGRVQRLDGRFTTTVYYAWHGHEIAYTILAAPALDWPDATELMVRGVRMYTLTVGGRVVTTWRRHGSTCVLSGVGVQPAQLERLAASEP